MSAVARPLLLAVAAGVAVAALAWSVGLPVLQSVIVALCVITGVGVRVVLVSSGGTDRADDWREHWVRIPGGVRRDVRQLGWRMRTDRRGVHREALLRLRAVAANRLGARGIDLADPTAGQQIRDLLGEVPRAVLTDGTGRPVGYSAYVQTLAAIERLHPTPSTPEPR